MITAIKRSRSVSLFIILCALALLTAVPHFTHAATVSTAPQDPELRMTIKQALLADPRTAGLSATQLNSMIDALASQAHKQGVTAQAIMWRPQLPATLNAQSSAESNVCVGMSPFFCSVAVAFGVVGPDVGILMWFGLGALLLVIALSAMILWHQHNMHVREKNVVNNPTPVA